MPPLNMIKILGYLKFASHQLKLPTKKGVGDNDASGDYKRPSGSTKIKQYAQSLFESKNLYTGSPSAQTPIPFFTPQDPVNKQHWESCVERGKDFQKLMDDCLDAIGYAADMWRLQAKYKDLKVNSLTCLGTPGCLDGPELENDIKNAPMVASYKDNWAKYKDAVAAGVSKKFKEYQDKVTVPGMPWYPAFVAWPGPTAPPMPNVPTPQVAKPSAKVAEIMSPSNLKDAMVDELDSGLKDKDPDKQHEALFDGIGTVASLAFTMWCPMQQVMLVMGKGPVPSFAPPYVPVGPVVMGDNIAAPGHVIA